VSRLIETLAAELERPRELSLKVINYITGTYNVDHSEIGSFLVDELPSLEEDELDLILSPVFTPKLADQAIFAELLGKDSVPRDHWPALIEELVARPTQARLLTMDSQPHAVTLRAVTVERYVHRLRLEAGIPESLFELFDKTPFVSDSGLLKAIARRAIWEKDGRRNILERYLTSAGSDGSYRLDDALQLLNLVENFKPADLPSLLGQIPQRQQVLRDQINIGPGPKPFFSGHAEAMHGGERDQRKQDDDRLTAKQNELAFLDHLQRLIAGPV
jgi:hypothetical protein